MKIFLAFLSYVVFYILIVSRYKLWQLTESMKIENPRLRKGLDVLATSLNHIGDKFERALEVKLLIVAYLPLLLL